MKLKLPMLLALTITQLACTAPRLAPVRFVNQPPVWRVDDRRHVARAPAERRFSMELDHWDMVVFRRTTRFLEFPATRRALGVNSVDEVPDSTWFTRRMGRGLTPGQLEQGPGRLPPPDRRLPWTIHGTKVGGTSVGFIISDATGIRYLLKFDRKHAPEVETGAHVVTQRLLWGCGFNVPDDNIVYFRRSDLRVAANATVKGTFGQKRRMTAVDLSTAFAQIAVGQDGRLRGLASRLVEGTLLGGWPPLGVRADDLNDRVPHQHRRDLRAQRAIFAWLNHTDIKEDNLLDIWQRDPRDPSRRYVVHYLIDFGNALGGMGVLNGAPSVGFTRAIDLQWFLPSLLTFGLWKRPWEDIVRPPITGVGLYSATNYHPDRWTSSKTYFPFEEADRFDLFWGAKLIGAFKRAHLEAAVRAGRYSDPAAARFLVDLLTERQRRTARAYYGRVSPLAHFAMSADGQALCFDDVSIAHGLTKGGRGVTYPAQAYDESARPLGGPLKRLDGLYPVGRLCLGIIPPSSSAQGYTIVRVARRRAGKRLPAVEVHLARAPKRRRLRVIGLWRR